MTTKTPEQIAAAIFNDDAFPLIADVRALVVEAIKADRAQRRVTFVHIDTMLAAWGEFEGDDVSTFIQEWADRLNGDYA